MAPRDCFVVNQRRHAEAGGFGEAHVTRDDGAVEGVAEMLLQLRGDIVGQADARIVHGPQQPSIFSVGLSNWPMRWMLFIRSVSPSSA